MAFAPEGAKGIDVRDYGAIPNDGKDDTAAIQKALDDGRRDKNGKPLYSDFYGRPKQLYFPEGTYDVSDTIDWVGNAVTLNGGGSGKTILKLQDKASGFGNAEAPKAVIETSDGNMAFRNNIWNLSVDTGFGNSGAIGIDYGASNNGSMENVTITSGDGQGVVGLSMADGIPGPLLVKDVKVDGFDTGIKNSGPYSATFKDIELTNQNQAGMDAGGGTLVIHGLKSNNRVPAIKSDNWFEMVTIVDGDLQGGAADTSAIAARGQLYARDIQTSGYQSAIKYKDEVLADKTVGEYTSQSSQLFDDSAQKSLNLPVKEFPEFNDSNPENWGKFEPRWYGDTAGLQDLLNAGQSTIYFPAGRYFSYNQRVVTVPPTVKKIVGFSSIVNGDKNGENGGGIKFVVEGDSKDPLIVEGFGYGVTVENNAERDVALKNGKYKYTDGPGASDLYIENIEIGRLDLQDTENVYAWQLNTESLDAARTKVTNSGANMVVFGIKTEGKGTVIETIDGGKTEVLGGSILPIQPFSAAENKEAAFSIVDSPGLDSEASINIRFRHYERPETMYDILVEETRDGETRQLESSDSPHEFLTLYNGNQTVGTQPESPQPEPEPTPAPEPTPEPMPTPGPTVSLPGPVASFSFDEKRGRMATDSSQEGQQNNGKLLGDARFTKQGTVTFDGKGDGIRLANSRDINLGEHNERTIALSFQATDLSKASKKQVLYEEGGKLRGLNIYLQGDTLYAGGWNNPDQESNWEGTWLKVGDIEAGKWNDVALVLEGSETVTEDALTLYLNGEKVDTGEGSQLWQHSGNISLGSSKDTRFAGEYMAPRGARHGFAGELDDVMIYNNALDGSQIQMMADTAI
ncbi:MAG: glycosyl hydrolase family 28-related protein [Cyanobacteria bacterium J06639_14]